MRSFVSANSRRFRRALVVALLLVFVRGVAPAREPIANGSEPIAIDEPVFPDAAPRERDRGVRVWVGSHFIPPTDFGQVDLGLAQPELRVRVPLPVYDGANLHLTGEFKPSFYDTSGGGRLFEDCPACPSPDEMYATTLALQGGYLLNRNSYLLVEDEQWALITSLYARARFESGAFEDSITPGMSVGLGYQLPRRFRVAVGARLERELDGDGVKIGPTGYLRWDPLPKWRLRLRGLGLQIEHRILPRLELFVTGFRTSDRFRMDDRPNLGSAPTFRDRRVVVGGGFVVKISRKFRITGESGAVVDRRVSLNTRDDGRIDSNAAGESAPYFTLRFELRP